jgi:hypothetical protein
MDERKVSIALKCGPVATNGCCNFSKKKRMRGRNELKRKYFENDKLLRGRDLANILVLQAYIRIRIELSGTF